MDRGRVDVNFDLIGLSSSFNFSMVGSGKADDLLVTLQPPFHTVIELSSSSSIVTKYSLKKNRIYCINMLVMAKMTSMINKTQDSYG